MLGSGPIFRGHANRTDHRQLTLASGPRKRKRRTTWWGQASRPFADVEVQGVAQSDLVAFGRVRQLILGGVTRHVLGNAELPVLMGH